MEVERDYYSILEISHSASQEEIKKAHRRLVQRYHPDTRPDEKGTSTLFQLVQEAYEVLSDPEQRQAYDQWREQEGLDKPPALNIQTTVSHEVIPETGEDRAFYVLLEILPGEDLPIQRLPLNLCLVLDRSTSMQGTRLQKVKEATRHIIDRLHGEDTLSIVTFSDRAEVVLPARRDVDQAVAKSIVSTIQTGGGTEILQGLTSGLRELEQGRLVDSVNHLILLTDGQTYGDEEGCLQQAEYAAQRGISLSTMGIGSDWNEELLDAMANYSGGASSYIESPRKVAEVFREKVRGLSAVVAREVNMSPRLTDDVTLRDVFQISPYIVRLDDKKATLNLGPLESGQAKAILLELLLQPLPAGEHRLLRLELEADLPGLPDRRNKEYAEIMARVAPVTAPDSTIPPTIVTALGKLALYKMQEKTMADLEAGDVEKATQRLETIATRLLNLGETELAKAALLEAGRLARTGDLSSEGRKKIRYGTRTLSIIPKEIHRD
jgi:Ca-activated chloride channel family protein